MSDRPLTSDCPLTSNCPLTSDHPLMSIHPLTSDRPLSSRLIIPTHIIISLHLMDANQVPNPTIPPSLITQRTLTKEPIQGTCLGTLSQDLVLVIDLNLETDQKRSLFSYKWLKIITFLRFKHQILLTLPPQFAQCVKFFLHFFGGFLQVVSISMWFYI